jgi:hypothetical protein
MLLVVRRRDGFGAYASGRDKTTIEPAGLSE